MSKLLFAFLIFVFSLRALGFGGQDVGNGGDAILCQKSKANQLEGYYSLDYIAQFRPELPPIPVADLNESLMRIRKGLMEKLPELEPSFTDFMETLMNETHYDRKRIWEKATFGLIDLKDERFETLVPENCQQNGKVAIVQAVIRQNPVAIGLPADKVLYRYVPEVVNELRRTNALQLSFLLVHEWLWDYSDNIERNRRVNYLLHSKRLELWNRNDWLSNLKGLGFGFPIDPGYDLKPRTPRSPDAPTIPPVRNTPPARRVIFEIVSPSRLFRSAAGPVFEKNQDVQMLASLDSLAELQQSLRRNPQVDVVVIDVADGFTPQDIWPVVKQWPKIRFIVAGLETQRQDYLFCEAPYYLNFLSRANTLKTLVDTIVTLFEGKIQCLHE